LCGGAGMGHGAGENVEFKNMQTIREDDAFSEDLATSPNASVRPSLGRPNYDVRKQPFPTTVLGGARFRWVA
jgi:hypothetical protein